jgi:hypothetical protein
MGYHYPFWSNARFPAAKAAARYAYWRLSPADGMLGDELMVGGTE